MTTPPITVKLVNKTSHKPNQEKQFKARFFAGSNPTWGRCQFVFGDEQKYDWLVVYDELVGSIELQCPQENTLLVTSEPSSIKTYDKSYLKQFGHVLTGQEDWALKHPGKIHSQPALLWYYGQNDEKSLTFDEIVQNIPENKTKTISTVCSAKQQRHTLHNRRYNFVKELRTLLPELDQFGKGVMEVSDKAETLDPYKYHIAIENHVCDHWWTEKLSDSFLGLTLPFYFGAPNASDYFPSESFIPIDIRDVQGSYRTIKQAIENNEYEKRLPVIKEARKLVLEKHNLFATLSSLIEKLDAPSAAQLNPSRILSRHELRKNPLTAISVGLEKTRGRVLSIVKGMS